MSETKKSLHEFYEMKVKDIMQTLPSPLAGVEEDTDVGVVFSHLSETDHVWVMSKKEPKQVCGVITESDTIPLFSPPYTPLQPFDKPPLESFQFGLSLAANEIMSRQPVTVVLHEKIVDVILKMKQHKIKQVAVVDDKNKLVGEITLHHLIEEYNKK